MANGDLATLAADLRRLGQAAEPLAAKVVAKTAMDIEASAKASAPVDTGFLRNSIGTDLEKLEAVVGPTASYGCVLGANAAVVTEDGTKGIGRVSVGDKVLTQTGEYRPVIATQSYPATEKPRLVEITAAWRADKNHTPLVLTEDHKVLAHREGRNKWVEAGDLRRSDQLYHRRKIGHNAGTAPMHTCDYCGETFRSSNRSKQRTFCDNECRIAWLGSDDNPHLGSTRSPEARARMREAKRRRLRAHPEEHPSRIVAQQGFRTGIEQAVEDWLLLRGVKFEAQKPFGRHVVDFYLPETNTVVEADGAYWHQDQGADIERDLALRSHNPDVAILHVHFFEERFSPDLDPNPTDGVYYVSCNPGPDTFVEPREFEATGIVDITKRRFRHHPKGYGRVPGLYDLTVEGVHSFCAHGLLISNSYVEYGTARTPPQPYMGPAVDEHEDRFVRAMLSIGADIL